MSNVAAGVDGNQQFVPWYYGFSTMGVYLGTMALWTPTQYSPLLCASLVLGCLGALEEWLMICYQLGALGATWSWQ
jgi:hypothetical protein